MVRMFEEPSDLKRSNPQLHWGNKFGGILLPIHYRKGWVDPLHHVRRVKVILDLKKQCMEAHLAYKFVSHVMSYLGSKVNFLIKKTEIIELCIYYVLFQDKINTVLIQCNYEVLDL